MTLDCRSVSLELAFKYPNKNIEETIEIAKKIEGYLQNQSEIFSDLTTQTDIISLMKKSVITNPLLGSIPYIPHPYQESMVTACENEKVIAIQADRQMGLTTTMNLYSFWKASLVPNFRILFIVNKYSQILDTIKSIQNSVSGCFPLGSKLLPIFDCNSIRFNNGSSLSFINVGRISSSLEKQFPLVFVADAAYISNNWFSQVFSYIIDPTLKADGRLILYSSGDNAGSSYPSLCDECKWPKLSIPHFLHPNRENTSV